MNTILEDSVPVGCQRRLGGYLKGLRKAMWKVSIEDMAKRIGCSKSYLWDVEGNYSIPSLEMAAKMAPHYKTTIQKMVLHLDWEET